MTCATISLDFIETEGNGMYETALPNWGGGGWELTL